MAGTADTAGLEIEILPHERTPLVETLLRVVRELKEENQKLRDEIDRLKGLPEKPRRPPQPSTLNDPQGKPSEAAVREKPEGKRPGSAKRQKTAELTIHRDVPLHVNGLPAETEFLGYRDFLVQDLRIESFNTRYRRARYRLSDGSFLTAPLPESVAGHFGHTLQAYVLYQHHHNQVTQPLLLEELREFGVDISAGQINRLLTEGHEAFHQEKDSLLPAAREVSSYLHTDDTSARHRGQGNHTLHLGNEFFASFFTTETKSRVNFLKILNTPFTDYVLNHDALSYLAQYDLPRKLMTLLEREAGEDRVFADASAWDRQLATWGLTSKEQRRLVTEAALWASLMSRDLYRDFALISDDAAQFKVLGLWNALCWIHCERHVARLIALSDSERAALDRVRDAIWEYYQCLKKFRDAPTPEERKRLEQQFEDLFQQQTGWEELNEALRKIHARKESLLLVLDHPEIPLHNNLSENDIRQYVKKRKISAGTRSDLGRRCRDTFLSLKTTCRKLGYRFWGYLLDRLQGVSNTPPLAEAIRSRAAQAGRT